MNRKLYIPVILGTTRKERMSRFVADFVLAELEKSGDVETELIDVCELDLPTDDAGENIKHPRFSAQMTRADAVLIVAPEYNHGYPGMLKHALDTNLKEYIHKAAGVCGVSSGGFGGTRVIENLLPVLRELGLTTIFYDGIFQTSLRFLTKAASCSTKLKSGGSINFPRNSYGWRKRCAMGVKTSGLNRK